MSGQNGNGPERAKGMSLSRPGRAARGNEAGCQRFLRRREEERFLKRPLAALGARLARLRAAVLVFLRRDALFRAIGQPPDAMNLERFAV